MTRKQLIAAIADAIEHHEGFHVTREQAERRGIRWPTRAQRNNNPGNIRRWSRGGKLLPTEAGYVNFMTWAIDRLPEGASQDEITRLALAEGRDIHAVLIGQYIDGKYHGGVQPTVLEFFAGRKGKDGERIGGYAPRRDGNNPETYAAGVARAISEAAGRTVGVDEVLAHLITPEAA